MHFPLNFSLVNCRGFLFSGHLAACWWDGQFDPQLDHEKVWKSSMQIMRKMEGLVGKIFQVFSQATGQHTRNYPNSCNMGYLGSILFLHLPPLWMGCPSILGFHHKFLREFHDSCLITIHTPVGEGGHWKRVRGLASMRAGFAFHKKSSQIC